MSLLHATRKTVITTAAASAATILAITGTAVVSAHREVVVEVDGVSIPVDGFFTDVQGALLAANIDVAEHDKVQPALNTPLSDGDDIVVRTANEYTVTVDGKIVKAWSTATNVHEVLADFANHGSDISMAADRSNGRMELPLLAEGTAVVVKADGKEYSATAGATSTVDSLLQSVGVGVGPIDQVSLKNVNGTFTVVVTRITRGTVEEKEEIAFATKTEKDANLLEGKIRVVQEGKKGEIVRTYLRHTVDGQIVVNELMKETKTDPVEKIVAEGTKKPEPARVAEAPSASRSQAPAPQTSEQQTPAPQAQSNPEPVAEGVPTSGVWEALARCESGGNPSTNTGNGYYGMYQFSLRTWRSVGGTGLPSEASAAEQTKRAQILQARAGWGQWPACSRKLGLR